MVALWIIPFAALITGAAFLYQTNTAAKQGRIDSANSIVANASRDARDWLSHRDAANGEGIERALASAIAGENVTDSRGAAEVLEWVRNRRSELAADTILAAATEKINDLQVPAAILLLRRYLTEPHATRISDAKRLLDEAESATSDAKALAALVAMSDKDFERFKRTERLTDGNVGHPKLLECRSATYRKNLEKATQQRERIRVAQEQRHEAARRAGEERQRREDARRRAEEEAELTERNREMQEIRDEENRRQRAAAKRVRELADQKSEDAELALTAYEATLSLRERRRLQPALAGLILMVHYWQQNDMDNPQFHNVLTTATENPEFMRGILEIKPIVGPIVVNRSDGTWTTYDDLIRQSIKLLKDKGRR